MKENDIKITIKTLLSLGQKEALIALRNNLKIDYELARDAVETLGGSAPSVAIMTDQVNNRPILYNKDWSNQEKFVYILKSQGRFLKFREAAKLIVDIEGTGDENKITRNLTTSTNKLKKGSKIVKVAVGGHANTFWGLPKWLNDDGTIKEGHEYNEEILYSRDNSNKETSGILDDL